MPLVRLQSDERLVALIRRGHHAAFEALVSRYEARLLAFCRHMLASREDAEDVLQEVFAAAFNAILADRREINVRPWLYRIARNRSLNHLRRATPIGVDSMDVHFADQGQSTGDKVFKREAFRQLIADVQQLPETQRSALLLREIDALSYEQIAHAMETTVPSVKSLLVRARISLAEAAEARKLSCEEVRLELGKAAEGLIRTGAPVRRHLRECHRCRAFRTQLKANNQVMAAVFPVGALLLVKKFALAKLGSTASAGGAHVAGAGSATAAGAAGAAGAASAGGAGAGLITAGAGALATKAVAGLAAAALVTAGAVEVNRATRVVRRSAPSNAFAAAPVVHRLTAPRILDSNPQPSSGTSEVVRPRATHRIAKPHPRAKTTALAVAPPRGLAHTPLAPKTPPVPAKPAPKQPVTQVQSDTTVLPSTSGQTQPLPPPGQTQPSPPPDQSQAPPPPPGQSQPPPPTPAETQPPPPPPPPPPSGASAGGSEPGSGSPAHPSDSGSGSGTPTKK